MTSIHLSSKPRCMTGDSSKSLIKIFVKLLHKKPCHTLLSHVLTCTSPPRQHVKSGHYWSASKTPSLWFCGTADSGPRLDAGWACIHTSAVPWGGGGGSCSPKIQNMDSYDLCCFPILSLFSCSPQNLASDEA